MSDEARLSAAYSIMQSAESKLGGGEGVQGIYGSISCVGMQRIFGCMRHNCGLDGNSVLVDIGAGLGRPLLHALLLRPSVKAARGIELDDVKVAKAEAFISQTLAELHRRGYPVTSSLPLPAAPGQGAAPCSGSDRGSTSARRSQQQQASGAAPVDRQHETGPDAGQPLALPAKPVVECTSIEKVASLGNATHAYSFWEGIPASARQAFGRLFATSRHLKCVAVVQRAVRAPQQPNQLMESYGFGQLLLISNFPVRMSGSGASFQAYIFSKVPQATASLFQSLRVGPVQPHAGVAAAEGRPQGQQPQPGAQAAPVAASGRGKAQEKQDEETGVLVLSPPGAAVDQELQVPEPEQAPASGAALLADEAPLLRRSARQMQGSNKACSRPAAKVAAVQASSLLGFARATKAGASRRKGTTGSSKPSLAVNLTAIRKPTALNRAHGSAS